MIPHINLSSFAGGGKTTVSKTLLDTYRTVMIPKITTRPRRDTEEIPEYIFVSRDEFEARRSQGHFLAVEEIKLNGETHYYAIPVVEEWPSIPEGTELVLSAFGEKARIAQEHFPELRLVFISLRDKNLLAERLRHRCLMDGSNFDKKWAQNERYFASRIEGQYDFVVFNDGTPEECAAEIMAIIKER
jgi:guanylate kinase